MRRIKKASKYIPNATILHMYKSLTGTDKILFRILHKTGMRISEVKEYVTKAATQTKVIKMTPAKKNWDRIIPNYLSDEDIKIISTISLEREALRKRVPRFNWPDETEYSAHDFRATFISNALTKDLNPLKVQRIVGHKELDSTLNYARLTTENDIWMYDYITESPNEWTDSTNIAFLKEHIKLLEEQNAKLKYKLKKESPND